MTKLKEEYFNKFCELPIFPTKAETSLINDLLKSAIERGSPLTQEEITFRVKIERTLEENVSYSLVKEALENSSLYPKEKEELDRLNQELAIIHHTKQSKAIWYLYLIVQETKRNNEPYLIRGTLADLYVLYVLGILHHDPIKTGCCYQACLGATTRMNKTLLCDIEFRHEFIPVISKYLENIEKDIKVFHYCYSVENDQPQYSPSSRLLIPSRINESDYYQIMESKDNMKVAIANNDKSFPVGVRFNLLSSNNLSLLKHFQDKYGVIDFNVSFPSFVEVISDPLFYSSCINNIFSQRKIQNFNDVIDLIGLLHRTTINPTQLGDSFPDRETVYFFFKYFCCPLDKDAFILMEDARKGVFSRKNYNNIKSLLPNVVIKELNNIKYLFPRGHSAEIAYLQILLSSYFRHFKKEYIKIKNEFNS